MFGVRVRDSNIVTKLIQCRNFGDVKKWRAQLNSEIKTEWFWSREGFDLAKKMVDLSPDTRIDIVSALQHSYLVK